MKVLTRSGTGYKPAVLMKGDFQGVGMTSQRARDRLVRQLRDMGITSTNTLDAIRDTPRHIFVDEALASHAYDNTALPIGHNQTISQPYIVARMTAALLEPGGARRVLEVGTGCGYQPAILARLVPEVFSIERIRPLLQNAKDRFSALNCRNIKTKHGDGSLGWPQHAPFDGILVAAAAVEVPPDLLRQLSPGGRLIIPVGEIGEQQLLCITRDGEAFTEETLDQVRFVPLVGGR